MIKLVAFDYDGVFTDGNIYVFENYAIKKYNCKDGTGISLLKKQNIKTAIISAHKLETNIKDTIKHLNIDFYSQGNNNKLEVLKNIMENINCKIDEVAYIGDDLSDIEVLKNVGFSACPNDSIESCKDIVDYVCSKNGGEGCVREFIDKILGENIHSNIIKKTIKQIKNESIYQLSNFNNIHFDFITQELLDCNGNIYVTGVGKSEDISIHLVNLLKSIGVKSYYFNIMNSTHGDLGCIKNEDIIIFFSKSGNTKEIIDKINLFKCYKIGVCCHTKSLFSKYCDYNVVLPFQSEINNNKNINCIPSNSYMSQLFFVNILINNLIEKSQLNLDSYKSNHPEGNIGNNLRKVSDIIIYEYPKIIINNNVKLNDVLLEMTKFGIGCCFFVNENNNLIGVLSDGDIRRIIINNKDINDLYIQDINSKYVFIDNEDIYLKDIIDKNRYKKAKFIPVIDNNCIIGIINYNNLL